MAIAFGIDKFIIFFLEDWKKLPRRASAKRARSLTFFRRLGGHIFSGRGASRIKQVHYQATISTSGTTAMSEFAFNAIHSMQFNIPSDDLDLLRFGLRFV
jgi:hypothetical protein